MPPTTDRTHHIDTNSVEAMLEFLVEKGETVNIYGGPGHGDGWEILLEDELSPSNRKPTLIDACREAVRVVLSREAA